MDKMIESVLKEHKIVRYVKTFVEVMETYKQRLSEQNEKLEGQVQLEQRVRLQKGVKKIKGIQIVAHNIDVLDGKNYVGYCTKIKEMTIDFTDGSNVIITLENLEALLST